MDIVELPLFCAARNKKLGGCQETRLHLRIMHIQVFAHNIFAVCVLSLFILVKNGSIGHWVCSCGKMMVVILKPLSLWESVLSLIITMAWTHVLSLTLTVRILLKCFILMS